MVDLTVYLRCSVEGHRKGLRLVSVPNQTHIMMWQKKLWVLGESLILLGFILITDCKEQIFSLGVQTETKK